MGGKSPRIPTPVVMPLPDSADTLLKTKKKQAQAAQTASGRASTLLSGGTSGDDRLGN